MAERIALVKRNAAIHGAYGWADQIFWHKNARHSEAVGLLVNSLGVGKHRAVLRLVIQKRHLFFQFRGFPHIVRVMDGDILSLHEMLDSMIVYIRRSLLRIIPERSNARILELFNYLERIITGIIINNNQFEARKRLLNTL